MRKISALAIMICVLMTLSGCAATLALTGFTGPQDVREDKTNMLSKTGIGHSRSEFIKALGEPDVSLKAFGGKYVDSYLIKYPGVNIDKAIECLFWDIVTAFIVEGFLIKDVQSVAGAPTYVSTLVYDEKEKLSDIKWLGLGSNYDLSHSRVKLRTEGVLLAVNWERYYRDTQEMLGLWNKLKVREDNFIASLKDEELWHYSSLIEGVNEKNSAKAHLAIRNLSRWLSEEKWEEFKKITVSNDRASGTMEGLYKTEQKLKEQEQDYIQRVDDFYEQVYQEQQLALQRIQVTLQALNIHEIRRSQMEIANQLNRLEYKLKIPGRLTR